MPEPFTSAVRAFRRRTPLAGRVAGQLAAVNIFDSATRLAAQAFLSAVPVLFVIGAFAPQYVRDQLVSSLHAVMGLNDSSLDEVQRVLSAEDGETKDASGIVGALVTVLSATACSRALQRVCERSWHVPAAGLRLIAWRWVVWLVVWLVALLAQGAVHTGPFAGPWVGVPLSLVVSLLLWWWTQWLLLGGRVTWLPLLPGAALTAVAVVGLTWGSRLYVPRTLQRSVDRFGPLGAVFTTFSWLIALFTCVTVGIALGYVLAREEPLARWLRMRAATGRAER
ncbi:YhjD/YihY/BrkB family envelope integrity protein [Streptomyces sp. NPDC051320]|uniref:YhjD/YihY/BrkB family envelope integrity protein n=1 Tax=Streptomyces sp. NPDC051320 TaxID=3154644 RepID=UPI00343E6CA0